MVDDGLRKKEEGMCPMRAVERRAQLLVSRRGEEDVKKKQREKSRAVPKWEWSWDRVKFDPDVGPGVGVQWDRVRE